MNIFPVVCVLQHKNVGTRTNAESKVQIKSRLSLMFLIDNYLNICTCYLKVQQG
jgi:hypothetical protein